jgi:hypothetical protein
MTGCDRARSPGRLARPAFALLASRGLGLGISRISWVLKVAGIPSFERYPIRAFASGFVGVFGGFRF